MSQIPIAAAMLAGQAYGFADPLRGSHGWRARYGEQEISQFRSADLIAEKWGIGRTEMEQFALASHERAVSAAAAGHFAEELAPYGGLTADEGPRTDTSAAKLA